MKSISVRTRVLGAVFSLILCLAVPLSLAQNTAAEPTEYVSNLADIPQNLMFPSVVEDDGKLYVIGGLVDDIYGFTSPLANVYIYDIATGESTRGADMQYGVCWAEAAKGNDGKVYVFGGYNGSFGYTALTQIYDIAGDSWALGSPVPTARGGGSAVTVENGTIVLLGSYAGDAMETLLYDPVGDSWSNMAPQPVFEPGRRAAYWDESAIFVMGGSGPSSSLYKFDPTANTWTELEDMPYAAFMGGAAAGLNGVVYHFGGVDGSWADVGSQLYQIQKYDPLTDTWSESAISSLFPARSGFGYASDEYGRIFVVGGYDGASVVPTVSMIVPTDLVYDELEIVGPTEGSVVNGVVTISVSYSTPNVGMPVIEVFVDGVFLDSQTAPWLGGTVSFVWDTTALLDGSSHEITARGTTWYGVIKEDSVTVTVSSMSLEERLDALVQSISDLQIQLAEAQAQLASEDANVTALAIQVAVMQAKLDGIIAGMAAMGASSAATTAALNATLAALQAQLDDFQEQIDRVENKADTAGTYGMVTLVLVIVVIVLLALMFMMARKKP